ncbi:type II secretion system F family protein [Leifsonia sp. TF02-11]|nr:type II secretion system F family protein [Leifsonia sp. TF02-11]
MAPWERGTRAARDVAARPAWARVAARAAARSAARVRASVREPTGARASPPRATDGIDHGAATVAAAWTVAEHSGAPLSPALRGAATALRDRAETARDVRTALAGPRATARLMAWLPLVGVAMAYLIGVDVVGALVGGPLGWGVAVAGATLTATGRAWTARLVREASRTGPVAGAEHELVAIALTGGMSPTRARQLVAEVRSRIGSAGAEHDDDSIQRVLHIAERAGAPAVELLSAEARQQRRLARAEGRTRVELLAVRLLLPLGLCVLPAFVLLGVVPVILAMMSSTFTGLT